MSFDSVEKFMNSAKMQSFIEDAAALVASLDIVSIETHDDGPKLFRYKDGRTVETSPLY